MAATMEVTFECQSEMNSVIYCLLLAIMYVGSLYVCGIQLPRDHPKTVTRRIAAVTIVCVIAPIFLLFIGQPTGQDQPVRWLWHWLGIRWEGFFLAATLPLLLTMILFLGPLSMAIVDLYQVDSLVSPRMWCEEDFCSLIFLRNFIVAPISEEFIFRACMLPLLVPCLGITKSIFICPLLFGVAHAHHAIERFRSQEQLLNILFSFIFQFTYTTIFGTFCAFIFLRTGHLIGILLCHSFCNMMGFPAFHQIFSYRRPISAIISILFVVGLASFIYLLFPLSDPSLYNNDIYHF
ncbi:CAAX prenyl protease 2-like [Anneissia japonica]|uniref:CAAX prenyl protease 2-like n=1 Tax=Anneissia japonica TaxID=1529436 RepID=UPI0014256C6B|nr:CAAX prenyl protease 2-like [Anneissia japonica]